MAKSKALTTVKVTPEQLIKDLKEQIELVDQAILEEMVLEVKGTPSNGYTALRAVPCIFFRAQRKPGFQSLDTFVLACV
jgi:hypothetical protein